MHALYARCAAASSSSGVDALVRSSSRGGGAGGRCTYSVSCWNTITESSLPSSGSTGGVDSSESLPYLGYRWSVTSVVGKPRPTPTENSRQGQAGGSISDRLRSHRSMLSSSPSDTNTMSSFLGVPRKASSALSSEKALAIWVPPPTLLSASRSSADLAPSAKAM